MAPAILFGGCPSGWSLKGRQGETVEPLGPNLGPPARCPSLPLFWLGGFPTKIDKTEKHLVPTYSNLSTGGPGNVPASFPGPQLRHAEAIGAELGATCLEWGKGGGPEVPACLLAFLKAWALGFNSVVISKLISTTTFKGSSVGAESGRLVYWWSPDALFASHLIGVSCHKVSTLA